MKVSFAVVLAAVVLAAALAVALAVALAAVLVALLAVALAVVLVALLAVVLACPAISDFVWTCWLCATLSGSETFDYAQIVRNMLREYAFCK